MRDVILLFAFAGLVAWVSRLSRALAVQREAVRNVIAELGRVEQRPTSLTTLVAAKDSHELN